MELDTHQLMGLRSLKPHGWEASLVGYLLERCSLEQAKWDALLSEGLVELDKHGKYHMTAKGRREFRLQSKGKYF